MVVVFFLTYFWIFSGFPTCHTFLAITSFQFASWTTSIAQFGGDMLGNYVNDDLIINLVFKLHLKRTEVKKIGKIWQKERKKILRIFFGYLIFWAGRHVLICFLAICCHFCTSATGKCLLLAQNSCCSSAREVIFSSRREKRYSEKWNFGVFFGLMCKISEF